MRFQFLLGSAALLALAACAAKNVERPAAAEVTAAEAFQTGAVPGGVFREGRSNWSMADQYSRPHPGTAAAGASAWVPAAPLPAFVATGPMPPADAPAPPPAAVANRQPAAPASSAADIVRPEATAPDAAPATPNPAVRTAGLKLFNDFSCGTCHVLADAGATGAVGPALDGNSRLTKAFVVDTVTNGRGAMPGFGGQMSDAEIATLADYIVGFKRN